MKIDFFFTLNLSLIFILNFLTRALKALVNIIHKFCFFIFKKVLYTSCDVVYTFFWTS